MASNKTKKTTINKKTLHILCKLMSLHCDNYICLSMIDIINTCIMYRFYTYNKYIIIIYSH